MSSGSATAYRVAEKVNIPDIAERRQARIEMISATARKLAELRTSTDEGAPPRRRERERLAAPCAPRR